MRLLWARVGVPYSPATGLPIESQTVSQMVDRILAMPEGTRLYLLAPVVRGRKGEYRKELAELLKQGFQRVKVDGKLYEIDEVPALDKKRKHDIEVVVDRLVVRPELGNAAGRLDRDGARAGRRPGRRRERRHRRAHDLLRKFACPVSGFTIAEIEPRLFSFNNPYGACPACDGLGGQDVLRPRAGGARRPAVAGEGAIAPWAVVARYYLQTLEALGKHYGFDLDHAVARPARRRCATVILARLRRRADPHRATTTAAPLRDDQAVRGRDPQPGAALARDRDSPGCARSSSAPDRRPRARPAAATG